MRDYDRSGATLDRRKRRQSSGSRFSEFGDRLARTFGSVDRPKPAPTNWEAEDDYDYPGSGETAPLWDQDSERFPVARQGYDRAAVDEHVAALESELTELRDRPAANTVSAEIERVGQETSAILRVAYEQARDIKRRAQVEAEKCLSDAAANAVAMSQDAKRQLRELDTETESIWRERTRLIEDARKVANSLFTLAEEAAERFPAEPERFSGPDPGPATTKGSQQSATVQPEQGQIGDQPAESEPGTA